MYFYIPTWEMFYLIIHLYLYMSELVNVYVFIIAPYVGKEVIYA